MQQALGVLRSTVHLDSSDHASTHAGSSSRMQATQETLSALKRIKHALIGNISRKLELCSRPDDVKRIISFISVDYTSASGSDDNAHHQAFLQAADIVSALAIPQKECLEPLIRLQAHGILLASIQGTTQAILGGRSADQSAVISDLYQRLLQAVRALKSLSVAIVGLIDPYGARAAMSELVLASAHARAKALGLSIPSANTRSEQPQSLLAASKHAPTASSMSQNVSISASAERMFSVEEAQTHIRLLRLLTQNTMRTEEEPKIGQASQQSLIHLCDLIATCVRTPTQRDAFENAQISLSKTDEGPETYDPFVLLSSALETAPIQLAEAIIRAMTALLKDQSPSKGVRLPSRFIGLDGHDQNARMAERMNDQSRTMRLAAAEWHCAVYKSFKAVNVDWDFGVAPVIAILLDLLRDPSPALSARAGFVLAFLVTGNQVFQETASNMEAFQRIKDLLDRLRKPVEPYETEKAAADRSSQEQAALLAVSALCTDIEELRRKAVEHKLLPYIVSNLTSPFPNVRCAAAQCARSLSRSINIIKTALLDTDAASAFVALLSPEEDRLTQVAILAVVCNVFIEFSPLKTLLLEMDGLVERIIELTKVIKPRGTTRSSSYQPAAGMKEEADGETAKSMEVKALLRHHALTAIKNMTYWSSSSLKQKTARYLTWEYAVALLRDRDMAVRTEMLNILRNIACNEAADIDLVVKGIGEARLFSLIEDSLHTTRQEMLLHALYLVSNIATGTEAHRSAIMNRLGIIRALLEQLSNPSSDVRVAAVWATINLCHRPETGHRRFNDYAQRLRALGFESRLKEMRDDPSLDVRERVKDALEGGFDPDPASHGMILDQGEDWVVEGLG